MSRVFLSLGANLGDRALQLQQAREALALAVGPVISESPIYKTASWGGAQDQPDYLNQVIMLTTDQDPETVLKHTSQIETQLGRMREEKWGSRLIDIDILFYEQLIVDLPNLQIPHPHLHERKFVLIPMAAIDPHFNHPKLQTSIGELLHQCTDTLPVVPWSSEPKPIQTNMTNFKEASMSYLEELSGGDDSIIIEMIHLFMTQTPGYLATLATHIANKDWVSAHNMAHHIKPTLAYMGADDMRLKMVKLEKMVQNDPVPEQELHELFARLQTRFETLFSELEIQLQLLEKK